MGPSGRGLQVHRQASASLVPCAGCTRGRPHYSLREPVRFRCPGCGCNSLSLAEGAPKVQCPRRFRVAPLCSSLGIVLHSPNEGGVDRYVVSSQV